MVAASRSLTPPPRPAPCEWVPLPVTGEGGRWWGHGQEQRRPFEGGAVDAGQEDRAATYRLLIHPITIGLGTVADRVPRRPLPVPALGILLSGRLRLAKKDGEEFFEAGRRSTGHRGTRRWRLDSESSSLADQGVQRARRSRQRWAEREPPRERRERGRGSAVPQTEDAVDDSPARARGARRARRLLMLGWTRFIVSHRRVVLASWLVLFVLGARGAANVGKLLTNRFSVPARTRNAARPSASALTSAATGLHARRARGVRSGSVRRRRTAAARARPRARSREDRGPVARVPTSPTSRSTRRSRTPTPRTRPRGARGDRHVPGARTYLSGFPAMNHDTQPIYNEDLARASRSRSRWR